MAREVTEKTLELNITAELLSDIRARPGGAAAFWIGMSNFQEAKNGLDEILVSAPSTHHLALQFKSPWPSRPDRDPYRFSVNDHQHGHLLALSKIQPDAVFYVLPAFNTLKRIMTSVPSLCRYAWMLRVADVGQLQPTSSGRHTVEVFEGRKRASIHSDPIETEVSSIEAHLTDESWPPTEHLLTTEALTAWLRDAPFSGETSWSVGQRLRGFRSLAFPESEYWPDEVAVRTR